MDDDVDIGAKILLLLVLPLDIRLCVSFLFFCTLHAWPWSIDVPP